ncbi:MAG: class IV adenylate cyclase [Bryobacteraceae bacterium]|nr:class IV adenylate cyclase [Bryobacteraceae bacterium]
MKSNTETEIKIAVTGFERIRARLKSLGFARSQPRLFEANMLFDTPGADLRSGGRLLRVRRVGKQTILTYKGPAETGRHKSREELEIVVSDEAMCQAILDRLGFKPTFRYEKYRTEYSDGRGVVTLDQTPIGNYLELEGAAGWIDSTAAKLGFTEADYITSSYGRLYLESGDGRGNMVFGKTPARRLAKRP